QVYSYSVAMEALSAQRTMMALTRDQLAEIETYSSIDKAYYTDLYNSSRTSIERIEAQMTKLSDNMFGEGESIWRHYIKFKNIYRLTYINKGNAKKILYPDMLCQRVDTLNASEVAGRIRDDVMNASAMSANDNLTVFNWAKSKNMTLREYLASVGFNMDDVPSSPSPVCLSLGGYEDSKSKMSFGPEGGLIHGYLWFIKYQGADVDQLDDARIRNLARYGKASKSSYESEARGWDRTYEGYVVNFKGDSDNSYADRNTIHAVSVRGDHIKSVSGSTWGFNGDSIRLEITPDTDHVVSGVTLTADDGSQIPYDQLTYSWESANFASLSDLPTLSNLGTLSNLATLSFTMPDSDVTVSVDFDRIALTADVEVENGSISLQEIETQNDRFIRDNKVQLTVGREMYVKCTAKIGYLFKSFSITDDDGNEYAVRDDTLPHSYFRFTVPDVDKLIIRAVFEEPECNLSIEGEAGDRINNQGSETPVQGDEIILKPYNILNARRGDRAINLTVMTIDGREVETEVLPDKSGIRFIMPAEKVIVTAEYADTKLWWYRVNNDPLTLYVRVDGKDVEVTRYDFGNVSKKTGKASFTAGYLEWQGIEYTVTYNGSTAQKITAATEHCVVIADPYVNVKQDEEVEFRVIPEEGYELYELTANDGHNREITKVSDDTYSVFFVADVVITARCREITPLFLDSYSLTLDSGNMGLNFYVDPKGQNENSISVVFSDGNMRVTKDKDGYLKYSCYIVPKNIDKVITASLIHNGKVAGTRSLSVADYCMKLLSSDADRVTKEMAQTTYDYGMAAKAYFFGTELDASVKARLDEVEIPESAYKYHAVGVGEVEGYNHLGFSFLLKSDITMREYFQLQGDPDEYSFIVDGKRVRPVKKGDYYYIDITRIQPHDIDNTHHYYVYKGSRPEAEDSGHTFELEYAPSTWLYNRVYESKTDEGLVYVCRSLYAYHLAAEKYTDIY
ncbi:MAG: hypothetical protein IJ080_05525, partial [Oscillospiraceae bacterium]|nr:hypothetical protein [Oscillospiraceae bacterium]